MSTDGLHDRGIRHVRRDKYSPRASDTRRSLPLTIYSRDRTRRSVFNTIGYRAISQISAVLSYAVLVRSTTPETFGVLNLLYAVIPVINTFGSLGLDHALRRYQPEYLQSGRLQAAAWLIRIACRYRFAANVVLIALILGCWNWVAPVFELTPHRMDFLVFSALILIHFQVTILQYAMASYMRHQYSVGSVAILSVGKLSMYSILVATDELTLRNAILSDLIAYGAAYAFLWRGYRATQRESGESVDFRPDRKDIFRLRRYCGYSHFNDVASILQYSETDRFFIAALINPIAVAAYSFYTRLGEMCTSLIPQRLFDNLVQPLFFRVPYEEAQEKIPRYFTFLINMSLLYQLPLITFTAVFHHDIVILVFGGKYADHSYLLPLVVAFTTTDYVFSVPIHLVAQYKERAGLILKSQLTGTYQVLAMLVLVPAFGLLGAALASGTFHILRNLFVWWNVRHEGRWTNARAALLTATVVWGGAATLCVFGRDQLALPVLAELALGGIVCALALMLYIRSPAVADSDRQILGNILHGNEGKALRWLGLLPRSEGPA